MPAVDTAMGTPSGGMDSSSGAPGSKTTNGWASPSIIGLLAFGMTTILYGLMNLPKPYGNGFVGYAGIPMTDIVLGGLILILVGVISLSKNHTFWGSVFLGWGAFWGTWAIIGTAHGYGAAGLAFVWLLFTLTFLISSMKHGWMTFFLFLFLFVGMILLVIEFWQYGANPTTTISSGEMWAVGVVWIISGLIAWYLGTADLTNHSYSKKILPT